MNDTINFFLKILSNLEAWFCSIKIYINSPTIIYNITTAIDAVPQTEEIKNLKFYIKEGFLRKGLEQNFNTYLKLKRSQP